MRRLLLTIALATSAGLVATAQADPPKLEGTPASAEPPKGFVALFNGKDLAGWHGMSTFDPRKLAAMPAEEREASLKKWTDDAKAHWKVENGELVNDGFGAYLTT